MRLVRNSDGSRLAEASWTCVDDVTVAWSSDRVYPHSPGQLHLAAKGCPPASTPGETYEFIVEPAELGVMLAAMRPEAAEQVMGGFLGNAPPEVVGAVSGWIVTHLARGTARGPSRAEPGAAPDRGGIT